ncbi:MAG: A24 family peptidase [Endomicrobium sp.]|jgi:leader peptidase (prepilin peptidase)/N-methyltransferase|nr:A24 family peptidase [Endomicrobium sp.]
MASFILGVILVFCIGFMAGSIIYRTHFIKLLSAFSFVFLFYKFSFSLQFAIFAFLVMLLISISVIDCFYKIIPVIFSAFLIIFGILSSFINLTLGETCLSRFLNSFLGVFTGGGSLFILGVLGQFVYKKEVIGGGDVKLMAGVGAFIGWEKVLFAIFVAAVLCGIVGLILVFLKKIERKEYIPFGPFLSTASFISLFIPKPSLMFI